MKLYVQWALADPQDWVAIDVSRLQHITKLPRKAQPVGGELIDNIPGWLNALNCQGITFEGFDHYAIEIPSADVLAITGWQDDPDDWGDVRYAMRWELHPPAPDPNLGGALNTRQFRTVWGNDAAAATGVSVDLPWADFVPPPTNLIFHGTWLDEGLFDTHKAVRSQHGWREWS